MSDKITIENDIHIVGEDEGKNIIDKGVRKLSEKYREIKSQAKTKLKDIEQGRHYIDINPDKANEVEGVAGKQAEPLKKEQEVNEKVEQREEEQAKENDVQKYKVKRIAKPNVSKITINNSINGDKSQIDLPNLDNVSGIIINNTINIERENNGKNRRPSVSRAIAGIAATLALIGLLRGCTENIEKEEKIVEETPIVEVLPEQEIIGAREEVKNPGEILYALVQACAQEEMTDAEIKGVLAIQNTELYNWKNQQENQETTFDLAEDFESAKSALAEAEAKLDSATSKEEKSVALAEVMAAHQAMSEMYAAYSDFVQECVERFKEATNSSPDKIMDRETALVESLAETFESERTKCNRNIALSLSASTMLDVDKDVNVEYGSNGVGVYVYNSEAVVQTREQDVVIGDNEFIEVVEDRGSNFEVFSRTAGEVIDKAGDLIKDGARGVGEVVGYFIDGVKNPDGVSNSSTNTHTNDDMDH